MSTHGTLTVESSIPAGVTLPQYRHTRPTNAHPSYIRATVARLLRHTNHGGTAS